MLLRPQLVENLIIGASVTVVLVAIAIAVLHASIRRSLKAPRRIARIAPDKEGLAYYTLRIPTERGKRLSAWMVPATGSSEKQPAPAVAILHGWGGNSSDMLPLALPLQAAGYTVLLVEARCHGRSDSDDFASLPRFAEDLDAAVGWLRKVPAVDAKRIAVLGHSVGGAAALLSASRRQDLRAVVSIGAFAHPAAAMRRWLRQRRIPYFPIGWYVLRYVQRVIGHRFDAIAPVNTIGRVACPVLLVHGRNDATVPLAEARQIHDAREDTRAELLVYDGDHEGSAEFGEATAQVLDFLVRSMGGQHATVPAETAPAEAVPGDADTEAAPAAPLAADPAAFPPPDAADDASAKVVIPLQKRAAA